MHAVHTTGEVVQTVHGPVRGLRGRGTRLWQGIPYAAPPVGELRFRDPRPPVAWVEVLDAVAFGACEPQSTNAAIPLGPDVRMDEDCLTLNVWAPEDASSPKPVMVWIHGGAYFRGASSQPVFDATSLVEHGDVVVVTFNYRLGAFGFLDLSSFSTDGQVFDANVALKDMIAVLEWVQTNIAAFGGDPGRVTLFGESAGGGAVTTLMTVPAAEGLFHRAIAESSPATSVYGPARAADVAAQFIALAGLEPGDAEGVRALSTAGLLSASDALFAQVPQRSPGTIAFAPVVDGTLVTDYPVRVFREGHAHRVPLIIGTNKDESSLFRLMKSPLMPIEPATIRAMFAEVAAEHPELELPDEAQLGSAYTGLAPVQTNLGITRDFGFRMPTVWIAEAHSRHAPCWVYRFDYAPPMLKALRIGATHATELPYVWGNLSHGARDITYKLGGRRTAERVSARMQARWLAFAQGSDPVVSGAVAGTIAGSAVESVAHAADWPRYALEDRASLVIDTEESVAFDLDGPLREAWGDHVLAFV
ncbi:carboxylesterase/lipase family protein [Plantibacter sp. YIM 135249]|uniref:carboxylesterase/lipase family protein n=1 Tax=Plantibacter sp. YIM 135249 TaxID=3423918 RepID=UPI003D34493C